VLRRTPKVPQYIRTKSYLYEIAVDGRITLLGPRRVPNAEAPMPNLTRRFDPGSMAVIGITFLLFVVALFLKGFSKEMLLERGSSSCP